MQEPTCNDIEYVHKRKASTSLKMLPKCRGLVGPGPSSRLLGTLVYASFQSYPLIWICNIQCPYQLQIRLFCFFVTSKPNSVSCQCNGLIAVSKSLPPRSGSTIHGFDQVINTTNKLLSIAKVGCAAVHSRKVVLNQPIPSADTTCSGSLYDTICQG